MKPPTSFLILILAISVPVLCQQTPPPQGRTVTPGQAAQPRIVQIPPPQFDEKADAKAAIKAAVQSAAIDGIRVVVAWGANDDKGSKLFLEIKRAPALQKPGFFAHEYKTADISIGKLDKNIDVAKSYGAILQAGALPALTVLDSTGRVIANTNAAALRPANDPAGIDPEKFAAFLEKYQAPAPDAAASFQAALNQAKKEGKTAFVWFSAPW